MEQALWAKAQEWEEDKDVVERAVV